MSAADDWKKSSFGEKLLNKDGASKSTLSLLEKKDLVIIYFSASWCPPCQKFTPMLKSFYEECCVDSKTEIVFVSSDRDFESFNKYFAKMPWTAMPLDGTYEIKKKMAEKFKVTGIPYVVVMNLSTGKPMFVSDTARNDLLEIAGSKAKGDSLIAEWKNTKGVHIDEATFSSERSLLNKAFWFLLKNPMYVFGIFYMCRKFLKYLQDLGEEDAIEGDVETEL